jgi:hypothetical protein
MKKSQKNLPLLVLAQYNCTVCGGCLLTRVAHLQKKSVMNMISLLLLLSGFFFCDLPIIMIGPGGLLLVVAAPVSLVVLVLSLMGGFAKKANN